MLEQCVNTILINKYYEEQEDGIRCKENFFDDIEEYLMQLEDIVTKIKECEEQYIGYDLEDYRKELIGEYTK